MVRHGKHRQGYAKDYYRKNRKRLLEYGEWWRDNNRDKISRYNKKCNANGHKLRQRYNISLEYYNNLLEKQNGVCAICGCTQPETNKKTNKLTVDHNHKTGKVRGLLCTSCNLKLGHIEDIEFIVRAREYLNSWQD